MIVIVLALLTLALSRAESVDLSYGASPVGFRVIETIDAERDRPIRIHVWYPAAASAAPMRLGDYFDALETPTDAAKRAESRRERVADLTTLTARLFGPVPDGSIDAMLSTPMRARRDATPAKGRSTLIVSSLTPLSTAITNEVLASYGFVVAAVQYRPIDDADGAAAAEGRLTTAIRRDQARAIARLREEPYVAAGPVGAFGFSGAGVPSLALAASHPDVGALVLFETGWHGPRGSSLAAVDGFAPAQLRAPFLFVQGTNLSYAEPQMKDLEAMTQSPRTIARAGAPGLSHWDFAAEGYLAAADPHWRAADRAAVRAIFEEGNALAVSFFDRHLRAGSAAPPRTPHFRVQTIAPGSSQSATSSIDPSPVLGIWRGTVIAGSQTSDAGIEIRQLAKGVGFFLTLPPLHAWRMPVSYLTATPDGRWTIDDWQIAVRRDGDRLVGQLGDPRVTISATRAEALPAEPASPEYPSGPSPIWTYDAGAPVWAGLVTHDGIIYAADVSGSVHAIRAADGGRVWRARGSAPVYGAPLVTDDAVFVADDGGTLRRLARGDGREVWRVSLGGAIASRVLPAATVFDFDFHAPSPVIESGTIYLSSLAGVVQAIDAGDGRVRWRRNLGTPVRSAVAVSATRVFAGTLEKDVVALDRGTGAEIWRTRMTGPVVSAPAIAGDVVIAGSRGAWLSGFDAATGSERWSAFEWISWVESSGVLVDGVYYVGSSDLRAVRAIDPATGRTIWQTDVLGWAWGTPAVTRDSVYAGIAGPQKYVTKHAAGLVALDRRTGQVEWRRPVAAHPANFVSGYPGTVVVAGDVLAAPNVAGTIEGYRSGRQRSPE